MNLGENIKNLRIKKGLTRQDLAKELNVSDSTISRYENNKREPNIETLNKISQYLNVPLKTLLADELFEKEILNKSINLMIPILPKDADDVFAYLEDYTHDYDSLYNLYNETTNSLPINCTKGLLNFIFQISKEDFKDIYKHLIVTGIYNLDDEIKNYCESLYSQIKFESNCKREEFVIDGNEFNLPPVSFNEMKTEVDNMFPALKAEIAFLSNPNVEKEFKYSFDELAKQGGYQELLILAIEKAIRTTLEDIRIHLENGDIFDGCSSWISKDSPLYKIIKNHDNPPNYDDDEFL